MRRMGCSGAGSKRIWIIAKDAACPSKPRAGLPPQLSSPPMHLSLPSKTALPDTPLRDLLVVCLESEVEVERKHSDQEQRDGNRKSVLRVCSVFATSSLIG